MAILANHIKDMTPEEILAIFKPFVFLLGLPFAFLVIFGVYKLWKASRTARLFYEMEGGGGKEVLTHYFYGCFFAKNGRICPTCGKKHSGGVCPRCGTVLRWGEETDGFYRLEKKAASTTDKKESVYAERFAKLTRWIEVYKPYTDPSQSDSGDSGTTITVNINIR